MSEHMVQGFADETPEVGIIENAVIKDGVLVSGRRYTAEQWRQKQRDERMVRIETKLDLIMAVLNISPPTTGQGE